MIQDCQPKTSNTACLVAGKVAAHLHPVKHDSTIAARHCNKFTTHCSGGQHVDIICLKFSPYFCRVHTAHVCTAIVRLPRTDASHSHGLLTGSGDSTSVKMERREWELGMVKSSAIVSYMPAAVMSRRHTS